MSAIHDDPGVAVGNVAIMAQFVAMSYARLIDLKSPDEWMRHVNALADCYSVIRNASPGRPFVVAQLGQSLDGRIATLSGESRWINRDAALDHVHRLRAEVDAVVVGVGTVVADDPQLNVRRCEGRHPARVVIDPQGRMPHAAKCLRDDGARRLIISNDEVLPPSPGVEVIGLGGNGCPIAPHDIVAALFERGFKRLLIEGGAWTISAFIDAGAVDRLHVLVAPMILGSGKTGLDLEADRQARRGAPAADQRARACRRRHSVRL